MRSLFLILFSFALAACGQSGSLYLPEKGVSAEPDIAAENHRPLTQSEKEAEAAPKMEERVEPGEGAVESEPENSDEGAVPEADDTESEEF